MAKNQRGTHWVDPHVQGALIGHILFQWAFFLIVSSAMVFSFELTTGVLISEPVISRGDVLSALWERYQLLVYALIALVPLFCLDLLLWSHRFVGPMVKIRRAMRDLASGKSINPIRLRAGDYWVDLADDVNFLQQRIECAERRQNDDQTVVLEDRVQAGGANLSDALPVVS